MINVAKRVLDIEAKALLDAKKRINQNFNKAVEIIYHLKGKLIVTGIGKSGLVGAKIAATFASTGTSSFFLHPSEALHGDLGMISKEDGVLAISYSGESEELSNILPHIKRFNVPLIGMSSNLNSTLAKYADVTLDISVEQEACPLGVAPTASTTLTMALGDALAVALMEKRGFKREDFAAFHPGGSLGRQLYIKVKDIMRDKNLPKVSPNTPLKDAILVMSQGKLGNILIEEDNKLVAILSDGDLRRALMRSDFDLNAPVIKYATKNPKRIDNLDILASDLLAFIEDNKIQMVVIVDKNDKILGVVHFHDLIDAGIKRRDEIK